MVETIFTRERIDSMRPHIQKTVDSLLDNMIKEGGEKPVELVEKFSLPLPSFVSSCIFGLRFTPYVLANTQISCTYRLSMVSSEFLRRTLNISLNVTLSVATEVRLPLRLPMRTGASFLLSSLY